jgi:hypothetical protein
MDVMRVRLGVCDTAMYVVRVRAGVLRKIGQFGHRLGSRIETIPNTNSDRWNKSDISDKKHPILSVDYQFPKKNAKVDPMLKTSAETKQRTENE